MDNKQKTYAELLPQVAALIKGEHEEMSVLANVSAALHAAFGWHWVGFYMERQGELRLGPFQGPVACMHISHGRGVCGTAFAQQQTIIVPDVELFPGHIACSSLSRSEIVVPLFDAQHQPVGVLDIDSTQLACFDDTDREQLEQLCQIITHELYCKP